MAGGYLPLPSSHGEPQLSKSNFMHKLLLIVFICVFMIALTRVSTSLLIISGYSSNDPSLADVDVFLSSSNGTIGIIDAPQNTTVVTNDTSPLEEPFSGRLESEPSNDEPSDDEPFNESDRRYTYGSYKSGILPNENYFTYLPLGGTNNQLTALFHAITMAKDLNRTLIIPPIGPNKHIQTWLGPPYSTFYDLERLASNAGVKLVEWHNVKPIAATTVPPRAIQKNWQRYAEPLPCYIRSHVGQGKSPYLTDRMRRQLMLSIKFRMFPLDRSNGSSNLPKEFKETFSQASEHLLCVTDTYSLLADDKFIWDNVGKHLHYSAEFKTIVDEFVSFLLPYSYRPHRSTDFIGIHLRRGDIKTKCGFDKKARIKDWRNSDCFISIEKLEEQVRRLRALPGWDPATPVVIATNENDERELRRIRNLGWIAIDHELLGTVEDYGPFYPVMLDAAILTRSKWFLGSRKSAMSRFVANRAMDWYGQNYTLL